MESSSSDVVVKVNLITSGAPLLASPTGSIEDFLLSCSPTGISGDSSNSDSNNNNNNDLPSSPFSSNCHGGIVSVVAYAEYLTTTTTTSTNTTTTAATTNTTNDIDDIDNTDTKEPYVIIQKFDKDSPFVNMHPLKWVVNRFILHDILQLNVFMSTPSLLLQNKVDIQHSVSNRDITDLQTHDLPLLLSNTNIDVSYSWFPYTRHIHFDFKTGFAIVNIAHNDDVPLATDPVSTVHGVVRYIQRLNTEYGCYNDNDNNNDNNDNDDNNAAGATAAEDDDDGTTNTNTTTVVNYETDKVVSYQEYIQNNPIVRPFNLTNIDDDMDDNSNGNTQQQEHETTTAPSSSSKQRCWLTAVLFSDTEDKYWEFLDRIVVVSSSSSDNNNDDQTTVDDNDGNSNGRELGTKKKRQQQDDKNDDDDNAGRRIKEKNRTTKRRRRVSSSDMNIDPKNSLSLLLPDIIINLEHTYVAHEEPEQIRIMHPIVPDSSSTSSSSTNSSDPIDIQREEDDDVTTTSSSSKSKTMWLAQCPMSRSAYCQHRIHLKKLNEVATTTTTSTGQTSAKMPVIDHVEFISRDLEDEMPMEVKQISSDWWNYTILGQLVPLAIDAQRHNPIVGYTVGGPMPVSRDGEYRACQAGECPLGSLFSDAIRWYTQADFAFTSSGGYRGLGWGHNSNDSSVNSTHGGDGASSVKLTDLYAGLPFPNTQCEGVMSGYSVYDLFNYSTAVAAFEGHDTDGGGRLLQISGARIMYNTELDQQQSRLISIEIWDSTLQQYQPLDRSKLYRFGTDSYVCGAYDPYPALTGKGTFRIPGEVPGEIGDDLIQNIVAEYLTDLRERNEPWDISTYGGRLVNDTSAVMPLTDFSENPDSCPEDYIWNDDTLSCLECPSNENVLFSDEILNFEADSDDIIIDNGRIVLVNREATDAVVVFKSKPTWLEFTTGTINGTTTEFFVNRPVSVTSGDSFVMEFLLRPTEIGTGGDRTGVGTVLFGVESDVPYLGCNGRDVTFDVVMRVTPPDEYNYLGSFFYVGVALAAVVFLTALVFTGFVFVFRNSRVIRVMQPTFLVTICLGVAILGSSMIPLGIDDGLVPKEGVDIACMSIPWLISTGFTVSFSALFSKLWRINKLVRSSASLRRITIRVVDVLRPLIALLSINIALLLSWTIVDPLQWQRFEIDGQQWNTYGLCVGGTASTIFISLIGAINFLALLITCVQAFQARNISNEFSESKYIGIAIYGWFQIAVIGVPILFLIDDDNPTATYILQVSLIFVICISMMLIVFVPALFNYSNTRADRTSRITISGVELPKTDQQQQDDDLRLQLSTSLGRISHSSCLSESFRQTSMSNTSLDNNGSSRSFGDLKNHESLLSIRHGSSARQTMDSISEGLVSDEHSSQHNIENGSRRLETIQDRTDMSSTTKSSVQNHEMGGSIRQSDMGEADTCETILSHRMMDEDVLCEHD